MAQLSFNEGNRIPYSVEVLVKRIRDQIHKVDKVLAY